MSNILFCWNKDIAEYKELEEQAQLLKKAYDIGINALKKQLEAAEEKFKAKRDDARKNAEFNYTVEIKSYKDSNTKYYSITRKIVNPLAGDTEFNKDITYCSFKLVNGVIIISGGGYMFQEVYNGDVIDNDDIVLLQSGIVPEIFKNKPKIDGKIWTVGS